ncbi:MAG: histidine kinase [Bacteroidetes bacterium]|nr:histidine kinase [Bacteroidota bacterium]
MKLAILLLAILSLPLAAQPGLTISKEQRVRTVAPFACYYEDMSRKLTYEQIARFPLDSFKRVDRAGAIQLGIRSGTIWLRFQVVNRTERELVLLSTQWRFTRLDVYVVDEKGQLTIQKLPSTTELDDRVAPIAQALSMLGKHPRTVHLAVELNIADFYNDYLQLTDMGYALWYQKQNSFWNGTLVGVYLLILVYALVFYLRLRDPLIGWYILFVFANTHWFIDRSGYLLEFLGQHSWYAQFRPYYPIHLVFLSVWAGFLTKFIRLKYFAKWCYYLIIFWLGIDVISYLILIVTSYMGTPYPLMRILTHELGIEYVGYLAIGLFFLLIGLIYVVIRDFQQVRWYALGFGIGLVSMIIAILALYDFEWLPHYPFNNYYFFGSLLEITIIGFVLAERTNQHRKDQARTQQQLIVQLQENLRQQNKLLQLRDEIARDLHDEVGATLTGIATSAKVIEKKMGHEQEEVKAVLGQMTTDSQEAIHTIRDTIWALNPDNDAPDKLVEKMKSVGFKLLIPHGIAFVFENEVPVSQLPVFSMEQRRNLYLVYKEALHNIAKHSEAANAQVRIFQQKADLHVRISDDGKGFDVIQTQEGNGLKNFQKRAKEGGFEVKVKSAEGVEVEIIILFNHKVHHE